MILSRILPAHIVLAALEWRQLSIFAVKTGRQGTSPGGMSDPIGLHQIISVHRLVVVLLIELLLRDASGVIKEPLRERLILPLNPLILLLPY